MLPKIEYIQTQTWHRIMEDLKAAGCTEIHRYTGMDAGIDYQRYDLMHQADNEVIIFEWDNWSEGSIQAMPSRLDALRKRYQLATPGAEEA